MVHVDLFCKCSSTIRDEAEVLTFPNTVYFCEFLLYTYERKISAVMLGSSRASLSLEKDFNR